MRKVLGLEIELAVGVVGAVAIEVSGQDHGLPGCRAAIGARVHLLAGFVMLPDGTRRVHEQRGVETNLLVRRRTEVVVGEGHTQAAVKALCIMERVHKPALDHRPCTEVFAIRTCAEIGVRRGLEDIFTGALFERVAVDGLDAMTNGLGAECAILIVPAVGCAIGGHEVPFRKVDVLADDVGRRGDLVVVDVVILRHEVCLIEHRTVERVQTEHERLRWACLRQGRRDIFPERDDALLREVITELVEHNVELDVRRLVDARVICTERCGEGVSHPARCAGEEFADRAGCEEVTFIILAGLEEGRARLRQVTVGREGR